LGFIETKIIENKKEGKIPIDILSAKID